jgi:hypothetical protein
MGTRRKRARIGRKEKREGAGCSARTVRRPSTCGADAMK